MCVCVCVCVCVCLGGVITHIHQLFSTHTVVAVQLGWPTLDIRQASICQTTRAEFAARSLGRRIAVHSLYCLTPPTITWRRVGEDRCLYMYMYKDILCACVRVCVRVCVCVRARLRVCVCAYVYTHAHTHTHTHTFTWRRVGADRCVRVYVWRLAFDVCV